MSSSNSPDVAAGTYGAPNRQATSTVGDTPQKTCFAGSSSKQRMAAMQSKGKSMSASREMSSPKEEKTVPFPPPSPPPPTGEFITPVKEDQVPFDSVEKESPQAVEDEDSVPAPTKTAPSPSKLPTTQTSKRNYCFSTLPKNYFGSNVSLWEHDTREGLASSSYTSRALEHLKLKSLQEVWSLPTSSGLPTMSDFFLKTYLDLTFRTVHYLGYILAYWIEKQPSSSTAPSATQESQSKRKKSLRKKKLFVQRHKPIVLIWDTGLISKSMQPLYCIMIPFNKPPRHESTHQFNARWCIRYFQVPSKFASQEKRDGYLRLLGQEFCDMYPNVEGVRRSLLPRPAYYFSGDASHVQSVMFDPRVSIKKIPIAGYGRSTLAKSCLPPKLQSLTWQEIEQKVRQGLDESITLCQRNHRMALPVCVPRIEQTSKNRKLLTQKCQRGRENLFFDDFDCGGHLEVQLLIPVCTLRRTYSPDCAATLRFVNHPRTGNASTSKPYYEVTRLMSVDEAFLIARRCQNVDQTWLSQAPLAHGHQPGGASHFVPLMSEQSAGVSGTSSYYGAYPSAGAPPSTTGCLPGAPVVSYYTPSIAYGSSSSMSPPQMLTWGSGHHAENLPANYKTTLCSSFKFLGYCPYGVMCHFAHGIHELRGHTEQHYPQQQYQEHYHPYTQQYQPSASPAYSVSSSESGSPPSRMHIPSPENTSNTSAGVEYPSSSVEKAGESQQQGAQ